MAFTSIGAKVASWWSRARLWLTSFCRECPSFKCAPLHWPRLRCRWKSWCGVLRSHLNQVRAWMDSGHERITRLIQPLHHISRIVCAFLSLTILLSGAFIGALYTFVTPDSACRLLSEFSRSVLAADTVVDGPVEITLLPKLTVKFPRVQLKRISDGAPCGSVNSAAFDVSLWSLPLGVIRIEHAQLHSPQTTLDLTSLLRLTQHPLETAFPKWLLIQSFSVHDATLNLNVEQKNIQLGHLTLELGQFSPEMKTQSVLKTDFHADLSQVGPVAGHLEISTSLAFSASTRHLAFASLQLSGSTTSGANSCVVDASVEKLSLTPTQASGRNIQIHLTPRQEHKAQTHLSLLECLWEKNRFASPELRLSYSGGTSLAAKTLSLSSALDLNLETLKGDFKNVLGTLSVPGTSTNSKPDILAQVEGNIDFDLDSKTANLTLAGILGKTPVSYTGHWSSQNPAGLQGTLLFDSLDLERFVLPFKPQDLGGTPFEANLSIGQVLALGLRAEKLQAKFCVLPSALRITEAQANLAGGRLQGQILIPDKGDWELETQWEGIDLKKASQNTQHPWPISGLASGSLTLTGEGTNPGHLNGKGKLRLSHGSIRGLSLSSIQEFAASDLAQESLEEPSSGLLFDEATGEMHMMGYSISLANLSAQSAQANVRATLTADTEKHQLQGEAQLTLLGVANAPQAPLKATLGGSWSRPTWTLICEDRPQGASESQIKKASAKMRALWRRLKKSLGL